MIGIIDYGMGNIQSVLNAFGRLGTPVRIVTDGAALSDCHGLVLPGVGAFGEAISNLRDAGLIDPLKKKVAAGTPLLGICLGLQLLAEISEEHGLHQGLGIIRGRVRKIPTIPGYRLPHIGWNELEITRPEEDGLFKGIKQGSAFYFVHTYMLDCDPEQVTAVTDHGCRITAAIQSGSICAVQFHPEKSQTNGLRLLRNFISRVPAPGIAERANA